MKTGTHVRLVQPELRGVVKERRINESTDAIDLLVEWTDEAGATVSRWFVAEQLEEVAP
jgi:hypothetical protein